MTTSLAQVAAIGSASLEWTVMIAVVSVAVRQLGWALLLAALTFVVVAGFFAPQRQGYASRVLRASGGLLSRPRHRRPLRSRVRRQK